MCLYNRCNTHQENSSNERPPSMQELAEKYRLLTYDKHMTWFCKVAWFVCLSIELLVIYSKQLSVNSRAWNLLQQFPLHLCIQYCSHLPPCTISLVSGSTATKHQHHGVGMWLMTSQELVSVFST